MAQWDPISIQDRIKQRLIANEELSDKLEWGSDMVLVRAVAEEISKLANNNEFLASETKWNRLRLKSSALSATDIHKYKPRRKSHSTGQLKVSISSTFDASPTVNVIIPPFTQFSDTTGSIIFTNPLGATITPTDNFINIDVVQGSPRVFNTLAQGLSFERIKVNDDVANTTYSITVNGEEWTEIDSIYNAEPNGKYYQIDSNTDLRGVILTFGDGVFGRKLLPNDSIEFSFIETLGQDGVIRAANIITSVDDTILDINTNPVDVYVTNEGVLLGGDIAENLQSIKDNAPKILQTGDRATSKSDYSSLISQFTYVEKVITWGADETNADLGLPPWEFLPLEQNKVNISLVTSLLEPPSTAQKTEIAVALNDRKSPTDIVTFVDPDIITLIFNTSAFIKTSDSNKYTPAGVKSAIVDILTNTYGIIPIDEEYPGSQFGEPIYETDYKGLLELVPGVWYHDTEVKFAKESVFDSNFRSASVLNMYPIEPGSVFVEIKSVSSPTYENLAQDDGLGAISSINPGIDLSGSTINYTTGFIVIKHNSGLLSPYDEYTLRITYKTPETNLLLKRRYEIFNFSPTLSNITVAYK